MVSHAVTLNLDASDLKGALLELNLYLNIPDLPKGIVDKLSRLVDFPSELFRLETCPAKGATTVVRLKPSDSSLNLLAALRTIESERTIIKRECHGD